MKNTDIKSISDSDLIDELMRRVGNGNVIAVKAWVASDINLLPANGYGTRKFKNAELKSIASAIDGDCLGDCTDTDWDALYDAVSDVCEEKGICLYEK